MPFRVKNITNSPVSIFDIVVNPENKIDLLDTQSVDDVKASIINGNLYNLLMGRSLSILNPNDAAYLGFTDAEYSRLVSAGFFKGLLGTEHLLHPLQFTSDGYLLTSTTGSTSGTSEIEGKIVAGTYGIGIKPVIISGLDSDGYSQSVSVNSDGYLNVAGSSSSTFGPIADGLPAYGYPVEIGGVDESGNIQSLLVNSDGYLLTSTAISVEINSEIEGRVFDGDSASNIKPVISGGVYLADPTTTTLTNGDAGSVLLNAQHMQIVENKAYDVATDADKIIPIFIPQDRYEFFDFSGSQSTTNATFSYYISMEGFSFLSLQYIPAGDGYKTLTVYASNQNVSDITTATYTDVTELYFGAASYTTVNWLERAAVMSVKYLKIQVAVTEMSGGLTATWSLYGMKKGA